jgi:hypothetical protein
MSMRATRFRTLAALVALGATLCTPALSAARVYGVPPRRTAVVVAPARAVVVTPAPRAVVVAPAHVAVVGLPAGYIAVLPTGYRVAMVSGAQCYYVGSVRYRATFYQGRTVYIRF